MFIRKKTITRSVKDNLGTEVIKKTKVIYLMDGQVPNYKTEHPETQKLYKALFLEQEKRSIELDRPVTIFELYGLKIN